MRYPKNDKIKTWAHRDQSHQKKHHIVFDEDSRPHIVIDNFEAESDDGPDV